MAPIKHDHLSKRQRARFQKAVVRKSGNQLRVSLADKKRRRKLQKRGL